MEFDEIPIENEHREYKKAKNAFPKEAWETISAFENTDGGSLFLGIVENSNHSFAAEGVNERQKILDDFWSAINKGFLSYSSISNESIIVSELDSGKAVIEIRVDEAPDNKKPVFLNKDIHRTFIREGAIDGQAKGENLKALIRLSQESLDIEVLKNYGIDELNMEDVNSYRKELLARETYRSYERFPMPEFLSKIGVISKDFSGTGELGLTAGGLLFFGNNNAILHRFPDFQLDYFDKTQPNQDRWRKRISSIEQNLNVYSFFKKVDELLQVSAPGSFKLDDKGQRIDTFGAMSVALREGLINMLMHADYFERMPLTLNNTINYYEFTNPGKMKIASSDFFTTNKSRNRNTVISKLFLQAGYGERAGHGGEKIYESALVNEFKSPEITTDISQTSLKIWKVDLADSFSGKEVSDRERNIIKVIISQPGKLLSHKDIESQTGYSRSVVNQELSKLIDKKIIERTGKARATKYIIRQTQNQVLAQFQAMPDLMRQMFKKM